MTRHSPILITAVGLWPSHHFSDNRIVQIACVASLFSSGFGANGEYNSLRSTGYSRPLSVLKLKANAHSKYAQMGKKCWICYLLFVSVHVHYTSTCIYKYRYSYTECYILKLRSQQAKLDNCYHVSCLLNLVYYSKNSVNSPSLLCVSPITLLHGWAGQPFRVMAIGWVHRCARGVCRDLPHHS